MPKFNVQIRRPAFVEQEYEFEANTLQDALDRVDRCRYAGDYSALGAPVYESTLDSSDNMWEITGYSQVAD